MLKSISWGLQMQNYRNLEVWQIAHGLTLAIYRASREFPSEEKFGLTSQLRRSSSSVEANLTEGTGRGSDTDFARFVQIAIGSACETDCHLLLARDLGYLDDEEHKLLEQQAESVRRMLIALLKSLNRR